ncbi:hypothetical protein LCGC14_1688750 [marine sediment metagenome]|uniref:Uncharacterized protein n=1 Tax=marine sediment metagenome TaxID=412755 RepID=A0A0F9HLX0_9ZZZZ
MIIVEVDTIRYWMTMEGRDVTDVTDLPGDTLVCGVNFYKGGGIAFIPCAEDSPEFAPLTWLFSFCGLKGGKWYVKRWAVERADKDNALRALERRAEGFGFEAIEIFQIDRPKTREERDLLHGKTHKRQEAVCSAG